MIKFDKLEEIYKDKKLDAILLTISILVFALIVAVFIINIVRGNICGVALSGVFIGLLAFLIFGFAITLVDLNKAYKEEQAKIEIETLLESHKILMKLRLAKEKAEQEKAKAETEKPKGKRKAEPKAKAETKTTNRSSRR